MMHSLDPRIVRYLPGFINRGNGFAWAVGGIEVGAWLETTAEVGSDVTN